MQHQGPGLLVCDEELFDRVWSRVTAPASLDLDPSLPQPPQEPVPQPSPPPQASLLPAASVPPPIDPTVSALQRWTLRLLSDAAAYRAASRQSRRGQGSLQALAGEKQRQARSLAAEYFLRSGVRYWPVDSLPAPLNLPFFPSLRRFYISERRQEVALRRQASAEEPDLAHLYLDCADAARAAALRLRRLLEETW